MDDFEERLTLEIFKVIAEMNKDSTVDGFIYDLVRNNPVIIANVLMNKGVISDLIVALKRNQAEKASSE